MTSPYQRDTNALADAIIVYLQGLKYSDNVTLVYVPLSQLSAQAQQEYPTGSVQKGEFKDLNDLLPMNSTNVCAELYGNHDDSTRYAFGGRKKDHQSFYILSITDMSNANQAETTIFSVSDAVMVVFDKHVQLGGAGNTWLVRYKPGSGRFLKVWRAGREYRAHVFELETIQEYTTQGGFSA